MYPISSDKMREILQKLLDGEISAETAEKMLKTMQIMEIEDFAKMDMCRKARTGVPEAVFAEGKDNDEIVKIVMKCANNDGILVTRLNNDIYQAIKDDLSPLIDRGFQINYNKKAKVLVVKEHDPKKIGKIGIITAGTSDIPVAEEARIVAEEAGCDVLRSYDVGVAGIHRLFSQVRIMLEEDVEVVIVVAGMEGALPSVVAGLVDMPVIGVPSSVGYGVGEGGFTALYSNVTILCTGYCCG